MKKRSMRVILCAIAAAAALAAFGALAAGGAGSQDDPLVTLSYLSGPFTNQVTEKLDKLLEERNTSLRQELAGQLQQALQGQLPGSAVSGAAGGGYTAVTLSDGQTLFGEAGCEVLLRSGGASCTGTGASALLDTTTGDGLSGGGVLTVNHLYLLSDSRGILASGETVLLVRGSYLIG